jgi:hypothetical protein
MKLYFRVTTFKSCGYLLRKSYNMGSPHLSGYFPYNSGHVIKNRTYNKSKIWNYISGSPHSSQVVISPGKVISRAHHIWVDISPIACILKAHSCSHSLSGGSSELLLSVIAVFAKLGSWCRTLLCDYSPSTYSKTTLALKVSSDWTSTHWVWVSFQNTGV